MYGTVERRGKVSLGRCGCRFRYRTYRTLSTYEEPGKFIHFRIYFQLLPHKDGEWGDRSIAATLRIILHFADPNTLPFLLL